MCVIYTSLMRHVWLTALLCLVGCSPALILAAEGNTLTYLVLADTVEPLMVVREAEPMYGGIVTDTLKAIFAGTPHQITPLVIPWQRVTVEMSQRDDWIMYGQPSRCGRNEDCAVSTEPIVAFDHVIVTLRDSVLEVHDYEDLFGEQILLVENFHYPGLDQYLTTPVDQIGTGQIRDVRAFSPVGALRMLRHRRAGAYIDWRLRVLYNLRGAGLELKDVRLAGVPMLVPDQNLHFFYSNKLPIPVRALIDERLATMHQNGAMTRILQRYH
jgi:hypothetical protein